MNYLKEILAFYDRQFQEPLSSSAVTLWHALMYMNNKTRWKNVFKASGPMLQLLTGLKESSFKRARAELVEHGYIEVTSQGHGKTPIYQMNSLVAEWEDPFAIPAEAEVSRKQEDKHAPKPVLPESVQVAEVLHHEEGHQENMASNQQASSSGDQLEEELPPAVILRGQNVLDKHSDEHASENSDPFLMNGERQALFGKQAVPSDGQDVDQLITDHADQLADHLPNQLAGPIYKQNKNINKTKQNIKDAAAANARGTMFAGQRESVNGNKVNSDAVLFYQQNFGIISPFVLESILDYVQDLGDELVVEAMKRALERNKSTWAYVKSILNSWHKKGIQTVEQARAELVGDCSRGDSPQGKSLQKQEVIPDWFYEQKEERRKREEHATDKKATLADLERVKRKFLEHRDGSCVSV